MEKTKKKANLTVYPMTLYTFLKTFTMPNLRKKEITIDFNGNLGHLWGVITH